MDQKILSTVTTDFLSKKNQYYSAIQINNLMNKGRI